MLKCMMQGVRSSRAEDRQELLAPVSLHKVRVEVAADTSQRMPLAEVRGQSLKGLQNAASGKASFSLLLR